MCVCNEIGAFKLQLLPSYKVPVRYLYTYILSFSRTLLIQINIIFTFYAHDLCTINSMLIYHRHTYI